MTIIESETATVNAPLDQVRAYLEDVNNFESLMPFDKIEGWKSTAETCEFNIKGLAHIAMKKVQTEDNAIRLQSTQDKPFPFTLNIELMEKDANSTEGKVVFEGKMNAFVSMMAKTPLTNFFNLLATNLQQKFS